MALIAAFRSISVVGVNLRVDPCSRPTARAQLDCQAFLHVGTFSLPKLQPHRNPRLAWLLYKESCREVDVGFWSLRRHRHGSREVTPCSTATSPRSSIQLICLGPMPCHIYEPQSIWQSDTRLDRTDYERQLSLNDVRRSPRRRSGCSFESRPT